MMHIYRRREWSDERQRAVAGLFTALRAVVWALVRAYVTWVFLVAWAYVIVWAIVKAVGVAT